MDREELNLRIELELCRTILSAIERRHKKSLRSQKVVAKPPRLLLESGRKLLEDPSHTTERNGTY